MKAMRSQKVLVFKTNLFSAARYLVAKWILDTNPDIIEWHIDQEDSDNVLRIVAAPELSEYEIISRIQNLGYQCEILP